MPASRADSRMRAPGKQSATPAIDKREDKTDLGDRQRSSQLTSHLNPGRDDGPTQERGCHPNGPLWGNIGHARRCRRAAALGRREPFFTSPVHGLLRGCSRSGPRRSHNIDWNVRYRAASLMLLYRFPGSTPVRHLALFPISSVRLKLVCMFIQIPALCGNTWRGAERYPWLSVSALPLYVRCGCEGD